MVKNTSFNEKLINFDYDKYYTVGIRFLCHLLMWIFFSSFYPLTYHFIYNYSWNDSLLFSIRLVLCNISFFYIIFYLSVPFLLNKNKIFFFILSIIGTIQIWLIINHYFFSVIDYLNIKLDDITFNTLFKKNKNISFINVLFSTRIVSQFIEIINFISPFFFIKISFDLTRVYAKKIKVNQELQDTKIENFVIENKFLQSQLNPHFLFNTLNNLYGLSLRKDDITPSLILKLSDIMRYTLYDISTEKISLTKELEFIDNYIEMEKMRYPSDYNIDKVIIVNNEAVINKMHITPLISFVFIENAFKYGLKTNNPYLNIIIKIYSDSISFIIKNDTNNSITLKNTFGGIGIDNAKKRLNLLYPDKHELFIENQDDNFNVYLKINL